MTWNFIEKSSMVWMSYNSNLESIQLLYLFFFYFSNFRGILIILKEFIYSMQIEKLIIVIITFLSLCSYNIILKFLPKLWENELCRYNLPYLKLKGIIYMFLEFEELKSNYPKIEWDNWHFSPIVIIISKSDYKKVTISVIWSQ